MSVANMSYARTGDGHVLLISYDTVIGVVFPNKTAVFTDRKYSSTTSKHKTIFKRCVSGFQEYYFIEIPENDFRVVVSHVRGLWADTDNADVVSVPNYKWNRETLFGPEKKKRTQKKTTW